MKPMYIFIFLSTFMFIPSQAQVWFYVNDTLEVEINKKTKVEYLNSFLKEKKATKIEFNSNPYSDFPFRLKNKKGNWMLFDLYEEILLEKETRKYSFQLPTKLQENMRFTWATRKGKTYWVNLDYEQIETKLGFEQVSIFTKKDTVQYYNANKETYEDEVNESIYKITVYNGEKWGLIEADFDGEDSFYLSHNFLYNSPEEVPNPRNLPSYQFEMLKQIREDYILDRIETLDTYGYYLKGRNKKTQLWGLFVGEGTVFEQIPMEFENIIRHKNPETYEVHKNGKVGYYNSDFELIKEPIYDDFHFLNIDYTSACALKLDGFWQLFDQYDGSLLVEGKAKSIEELQELWLNRH